MKMQEAINEPESRREKAKRMGGEKRVAMHGFRRRTDITVAWPNAKMSFVDPDIGLTLAM